MKLKDTISIHIINESYEIKRSKVYYYFITMIIADDSSRFSRDGVRPR